MTKEMSRNCKYFVQHAWKQDLCANCFESREDHRRKLKELKIIVPEFAANVKSILKQRDNNQRLRKNVVFRLSLTEIIGYGGDDLYDWISDNNSDNINQNDVKNSNDDDDDDVDDDDDEDDDEDYDDDNGKNIELTDITRISNHNISNTNEDDRALSNLTRNNTNFNRNIANLNEPSDSLSSLSDTVKITPKSFNNLILGNIQNDSDGKRKTLLVSVTPFGVGNNSYVISAGRSADKSPIHDETKRVIAGKIPEISNNQSNYTSKSVLPQPLLKSNQTCEKKCQKASESIITTKLDSNEEINGELTLDKLNNVDMTMDNKAQNHLTTNRAAVESVTSNVEQIDVECTDTDVIESVNTEQECESSPSETRNNNDIDNIELNEGKIFDDTSSDSSSIDCSITNSLPESSIVSPKPRNSFLHGGKNVSDNENPIIKLDEVNEEIKWTLCANVAKSNSSNVETREIIALKSHERLSEDLSTSIFTRKPVSSVKSDCPVVREKEKRERATSCSPKFRKMDETSLNRNYSNEIPESMSKRCATRSLSRHSSSSYSQVLSNANGVDDEIKKKNKTRFSLKRLLRIGSSKKDLNITTTDSLVESFNNVPSIPQFKSKPEIIHPLELDGAAVEILYHDKLIKITDENTNIKSSSGKATMREPPPPPPTNVFSSTKSDCPQLSTNKFTRHSLHDEQKRTNLSTHDTDREHPTCHSITTTTTATTTTSTTTTSTSTTTTSSVRSLTADSIHTGIHNFGKFRPIQCN